MPNRKTSQKSLAKFKKKVFRSTGISFDNLMKACAFLVIAVVGIGLTVLYTNADQASEVSGIEVVESKQLTSDEQFIEVSELPPGFERKLPVERIDILKSKIKAGEELAQSGGHYAQRATEQLVFLYGALCYLEESQGVDSKKSYERLAELRQQALAEGNEQRVAITDFLRASSATVRLKRRTEKADFRFATDAVQNLDSKSFLNAEQIKRLYNDAIELHDTSSKQDSTAIFLSTLGDKLVDSPETKISSLGLSLKDHPKYAAYYAAIDKPPYTTRESKLGFFRKLVAEIEKAPPQSLKSYQVVFQLLDRLVNRSDVLFAGTLAKRLREATPMINPAIRTKVDQSIDNIEKRISTLGKTVDLTGSSFGGSPLQLPNDKPTTLVFWRFGDKKSMEYLKTTANSSRFNPWGTNLLVACLSKQPVEEFEKAAHEFGRFTVLDYPTSHRLGNEFALEFVPYQVSLDKDGTVIRLGAPKD